MFEKYQLANAMDVILVPSSKSPVISAQIWVKTGSADENKGEEGLTHFIEHLLFKGTEKYAVGEIAQEVEGAGGQLNAYTSFDQTVYYMTLSKQFGEKALEMLSQMTIHPVFDPKEVDNEREVVLEEIKRGLDSPSQVASRHLFETAYKSHPYKRQVIGYDKVVKTAPLSRIKNYFSKRYTPGNMTLILVGDFQKKEAKRWIEKYFASAPKKTLEKRHRVKEEKQEKPRLSVKTTEFQDSTSYLAWHIPGVKHKDIPALDLLSVLLGYGDSSILQKDLRNRRAVVNSVSCSTYTPDGPGLFLISANHELHKLADFYTALLECLRDLNENWFGVEDLKRALVNLESHEVFAMETVDGLANKFGSYHFLMKDPDYFKVYIKQLKDLGVKDLVRVFKKYLHPDRINIAMTGPGDKKEHQKVLKKFLKSYAEFYQEIRIPKENPVPKYKKLKLSQKKGDSKLERVQVAPHVELVMLPSYEVPSFSLQLAIEGGVFFETPQNQGVNHLLSDIWMAGAGGYTEEELAQELESRAIYMGGFSGRNSLGLKMSSLSHMFEESLEYFFQVVLEPKFEQQALERERNILVQYLKKIDDHPAQLAHRQLMKGIYPGHPYELDPVGTVESLGALNRDKVIQMHQEILKNRKMVFSIVGSFDPSHLLKVIQEKLKSVDRKKVHSYPKTKLLPLAEDQKIFSELDKAQSHLFLVYRSFAFLDKRVYALKVLESILAGQGGRLFLELRDKASLAYTVSPVRMEGIDTGYFGAYIGCSPEKQERAVAMMKKEFQRLMDEPVGDMELSRAKQNLMGTTDIQMQRNSSIASRLLFDVLYGVGLEDYTDHAERVQRVTKQDVQEVARYLFSQNSVLSVVGKSLATQSETK